MPESHADLSASQLLGDIVGLMLRSKLHRRWPLANIEQYVYPALHHGQFRLIHRERKTIGYVSWAWLSQEVEDRYLAGGYQLALDDWKSGDLPWIIDFVAPYGDIDLIRKLLREQRIFPRPVKAIRPDKNGKGQIVMQFGFPEARRKYQWKTRRINVPRPPRNGAA